MSGPFETGSDGYPHATPLVIRTQSTSSRPTSARSNRSPPASSDSGSTGLSSSCRSTGPIPAKPSQAAGSSVYSTPANAVGNATQPSQSAETSTTAGSTNRPSPPLTSNGFSNTARSYPSSSGIG